MIQLTLNHYYLIPTDLLVSISPEVNPLVNNKDELKDSVDSPSVDSHE